MKHDGRERPSHVLLRLLLREELEFIGVSTFDQYTVPLIKQEQSQAVLIVVIVMVGGGGAAGVRVHVLHVASSSIYPPYHHPTHTRSYRLI